MPTTIETVQNTLNAYFNDTSRTPEETRGALQGLQDEIEILLDMLDEDND